VTNISDSLHPCILWNHRRFGDRIGLLFYWKWERDGPFRKTYSESPSRGSTTPLSTSTEPLESIPHLRSLFLWYYPMLYIKFFSQCLTSYISNKLFYEFIINQMHDIRLSHLTLVELMGLILCEGGTRWRSWLRHCAKSRKVSGSIPDYVIGIFHWHNPSGRTMDLGLTQPLTEMSTSNISWG
jgi:hypothetical protein